MAATACTYGYESCRPLMPAAPTAMGSPTPARTPPTIDPLNNGSAQGAALPLPDPPPPPLPPPPLSSLHLGARNNSSKARSRNVGICTESLGSESSESSGDLDIGDIADDTPAIEAGDDVEHHSMQHRNNGAKRGRTFPPPLSVISAGGKPWLYLRAHRGDGRLMLREVRIPSQELLQACRKDGRLKLQFAHPEPEEHHCQGKEMNN